MESCLGVVLVCGVGDKSQSSLVVPSWEGIYDN